MDFRDFQNNIKYKLIIPMVYIVNWILMITGPFFFPVSYQVYACMVKVYLAVKSVNTFINALIGFVLGNNILNKAKRIKESQPKNDPDLQETSIIDQSCINSDIYVPLTNKKVYHAFIIPNFKEDIELLNQTLLQLACHTDSRERYLVFLAMERHEQNSDKKAEQLIKRHKQNFKLIAYTLHQIRQHQQKGKASNVSWCAEHLEEQFLNKNGFDFNQIFVTIIDADSWIPQVYLSEIDAHISKNYSRRYDFIYQPSQIFTRNHLDVPIVTRTFDQFHSLMHFSNLYSIFNATFPFSNYTLSFKLIKQIGFWDTCSDAIGEDFHTTVKAFWKTGGRVSTVYIFSSFNQVNIQTGKGYISDIKAKFWQAERHGRGVADVAYVIKMFIKYPFKWRTLLITLQILQCFLLPAVLPWMFIGLSVQSFLYKDVENPPQFLVSEQVMSLLFNITKVSFMGLYLLYWILKRKSTTLLYGLQNESLLRIFEFYILLVPNLLLMATPPLVIAAFRVPFGANQYVVAQKCLNRPSLPQINNKSQALPRIVKFG